MSCVYGRSHPNRAKDRPSCTKSRACVSRRLTGRGLGGAPHGARALGGQGLRKKTQARSYAASLRLPLLKHKDRKSKEIMSFESKFLLLANTSLLVTGCSHCEGSMEGRRMGPLALTLLQEVATTALCPEPVPCLEQSKHHQMVVWPQIPTA